MRGTRWDISVISPVGRRKDDLIPALSIPINVGNRFYCGIVPGFALSGTALHPPEDP